METKEVLLSKLGTNIGLSKFCLDSMSNPLIVDKVKNLIKESFLAEDQEQFKYSLTKTLGNVDDKALEIILEIHIEQTIKDIEKLGIDQHIKNIVAACA